jgi:hypothetical protein
METHHCHTKAKSQYIQSRGPHVGIQVIPEGISRLTCLQCRVGLNLVLNGIFGIRREITSPQEWIRIANIVGISKSLVNALTGPRLLCIVIGKTFFGGTKQGILGSSVIPHLHKVLWQFCSICLPYTTVGDECFHVSHIVCDLSLQIWTFADTDSSRVAIDVK